MISLKGMDHALVLTVVDSKILLRAYSIGFKKSGSKVRYFECLLAINSLFRLKYDNTLNSMNIIYLR